MFEEEPVTTLTLAVNLSRETRTLLADIKAAVRMCLPTAEVLLYGSVARCENGPESDCDVLILTDSPLAVPEQEVVRDHLFEVELRQGAVISSLFYTKAEWEAAKRWATPFLREVAHDAIQL